MRFSYAIALILTIIIGATYWYRSTEYICPVPVTYSLGQIDDSFSMSRAVALEAIEQATTVWEEALGRDLFQYSESGDLTVSFVFDERQQRVEARASDQSDLDEAAATNAQLRQSIASFQETYNEQQQSFDVRKTAYDQRLSEYNESVRQANDRGGASGPEFALLQTTKEVLDGELVALREQSTQLQSLASQLNQLSAEANRLFAAYNQQVGVYNDRYGSHDGPTQSGHYSSVGKIEIYRFVDEAEMVAILAHEFGHALGIDHIDQTGNLMSVVLESDHSDRPLLTDADIDMFHNICQFDSWQFKLRQFFRSTF